MKYRVLYYDNLGLCDISFGDFSIHDMLDAAVCEVKHTEKFGDYYDIHGNGWGGRGSFVNDGKTKIIYL